MSSTPASNVSFPAESDEGIRAGKVSDLSRLDPAGRQEPAGSLLPSFRHDFQADIIAVESIEAVPTILDVVCRTTGMGFAAVARVTEDRWVACRVRDDIRFGLQAGGELKVETTICHEIRRSRTAVVINHVAEDAVYCGHPTPAHYGFQSYISMPIVLPDGTFFGTLCAIDPKPARLNEPATVGMFKLFADLIAFHLDAHGRLARSAADRERAWRLSQDLLVVANADGVCETTNLAWSTLLGWAETELIGAKLTDFAHPDEIPASLAVLAGLIEAPLTVPFESRLRHKDGHYRWFAWTAAFEGGKVYATGRDTTVMHEQGDALAATEDALRQAQKLEAIGQLTGGVAHDFNNLLTVIRSSTDLLKRPALTEERRHRYIEAISDTVDRAAKLTGQLLAFARRQALRPEVFDVGQSVRNIGEMLGTLTGSRIEIRTRFPEETCYVNADSSQFDTALVNMAVNARDAMDGEGRLTVAVETIDGIPQIRTHPARTASFVAIALTDTGCGIDAESIDKIFEPFFTTKGVGQGTGLGLSQVFGFAKQSGGEVMVESAVGTGTTFTLLLPRADAPPRAVEEHQDDATIDGFGTRVLVIEDNREVGTFSTQTLKELGYRPHWVANGSEALKVLASEPNAYDVVFSDVVMPGINGVELGREIKRRYPELPIVLTSGYSEVLARDVTHGFELLQKPYSVEQLSRILSKVVAQRSRRARAFAE